MYLRTIVVANIFVGHFEVKYWHVTIQYMLFKQLENLHYVQCHEIPWLTVCAFSDTFVQKFYSFMMTQMMSFLQVSSMKSFRFRMSMIDDDRHGERWIAAVTFQETNKKEVMETGSFYSICKPNFLFLTWRNLLHCISCFSY